MRGFGIQETLLDGLAGGLARPQDTKLPQLARDGPTLVVHVFVSKSYHCGVNSVSNEQQTFKFVS